MYIEESIIRFVMKRLFLIELKHIESTFKTTFIPNIEFFVWIDLINADISKCLKACVIHIYSLLNINLIIFGHFVFTKLIRLLQWLHLMKKQKFPHQYVKESHCVINGRHCNLLMGGGLNSYEKSLSFCEYRP